MGKKRVILLLAIVLVLVGAIAFFYLKIYRSDDSEKGIDSAEVVALSTIPNDAALVLLFDDKFKIQSLIARESLTAPLLFVMRRAL